MDKDRRLTMSIRAILNKIFGLRAIFCLRYFRQRRRFPDLDNPKDYSEILISRILSDEYLKFADLTDKVKVRDYVRAKGLDDILLEHYGHYDTFDQIDRDVLPQKFVLKTNRGASAKDVCICTDKSTFDWDAARKKLEKGMKHQYEYEAHYNIIKPRIICEELIDEGDGKMPVDYKFTCIEGKPASILVCTERGIGEPRQCTFDTNWKPLPYIKSKYLPKQLPQRPDQLERMTEIAGILSEDFEHVRVDLYEYKGRVFFSELTFTPGCGILYSYNRQAIDTIGEMFGGN